MPAALFYEVVLRELGLGLVLYPTGCISFCSLNYVYTTDPLTYNPILYPTKNTALLEMEQTSL